MKYLIGRDNLAATIYVPYDCQNNCPFCTSKKEYSKCKMDATAVKEALKKLVRHPEIRDIVFTGGEPTANPQLLRELVEIAQHKKVFINTTLPRKNFYNCLSNVFNSGMVDGVNVSRHGTSFAQDSKLFRDIVEDWNIDAIQAPVKVNAVLDDNTSVDEVEEIIQRWQAHKNVTLCFRRDFRKTNFANLHPLYGDPVLDYLSENYTFTGHTFCDVCDTVSFAERITFHRGMEESSFEMGGRVIINDVIVFPDGYIAYDWDGKPIQYLDGFMDKAMPPKKKNPYARASATPQTSYVGSCGLGGGCGSGQASPVVGYTGSCGRYSPTVLYTGSCGGSSRC